MCKLLEWLKAAGCFVGIWYAPGEHRAVAHSVLPTQGTILAGQVLCVFPEAVQVPLSGCPITAKGDVDLFLNASTENFYSRIALQRLQQRNVNLWPLQLKPWDSTGDLQFVYSEEGFAARFEPPRLLTAPPWRPPCWTHHFLFIFDSCSMQNN